MHVVPRYEHDPLRLPWLPGPGDPDEIAAAAELLKRPRSEDADRLARVFADRCVWHAGREPASASRLS